MKFRLKTSGYFYTNEEAKKLESLGFKFEDTDFRKYDKVISECGSVIELDNISDLVEFSKTWGHIIITNYNCEPSIEIYDNHRE